MAGVQGGVVNNLINFDYKEFKKSKDPWKYIEKKTIELTAKKMNVDESVVRLTIEQAKKKTALGYALKYARQRKRISAKKMAERLKISEQYLKNIESEKIADFPLGLITAYLNNLGYMLTFNIESFLNKR